MKKVLLTAIVALITTTGIMAQQLPRMNFASVEDFFIHPAAAGNVKLSAAVSVRDQWAGIEGNPQTIMLGVHGRIHKARLGIGGLLVADRAAKISRLGGSLALAYHLPVNGDDMHLSFGLSARFFQVRIMQDELDPFTAGDVTTMNAEGQFNFDAGASLYLHGHGARLGISVPQIVQTDLGLEQSGPNLSKNYRHFYLSGAYLHENESGKLGIEPYAGMRTVFNSLTQWDLGLKLVFHRLVYTGAILRFNQNTFSESVNAYAGLTISQKIELGYAYEHTFTDVNAFVDGGHEIFLRLRIHRKGTVDYIRPRGGNASE